MFNQSTQTIICKSNLISFKYFVCLFWGDFWYFEEIVICICNLQSVTYCSNNMQLSYLILKWDCELEKMPLNSPLWNMQSGNLLEDQTLSVSMEWWWALQRSLPSYIMQFCSLCLLLGISDFWKFCVAWHPWNYICQLRSAYHNLISKQITKQQIKSKQITKQQIVSWHKKS